MKIGNRQSGFSVVGVVLGAAVIAIIGTVGWVAFKKSDTKTAILPTDISESKDQANLLNMQPEPLANAYESSKQYVNSEYGFSFYYPQEWRVEERDPALSSPDTEGTEFALWLLDTTAKERAETAVIMVTSRGLAEKTAIIDNSAESHDGEGAEHKQALTLKGKSAVKYTFPQSDAVNREMYLFGVGAKTYSVETFYEETNVGRNPDYMTKFNKLVDSLQLP